jgi:hypothetical protein
MEQLSKEQSAVISAYTGYLCGNFGDMQEYVTKIMGRPVWTHEFADPVFAQKIRELAKEDFLSLCYKG